MMSSHCACPPYLPPSFGGFHLFLSSHYKSFKHLNRKWGRVVRYKSRLSLIKSEPFSWLMIAVWRSSLLRAMPSLSPWPLGIQESKLSKPWGASNIPPWPLLQLVLQLPLRDCHLRHISQGIFFLPKLPWSWCFITATETKQSQTTPPSLRLNITGCLPFEFLVL